jgi:hypothetical protein
MRENAIHRIRAVGKLPLDPFQISKPGALHILVEHAKGDEGL